jgi:uncharacterized damage-inducible protein DinB
MSIAAFIQEFEQEAATTRRVLARVPTDKLDWAPHAKSMNLGYLAMHTATAPSMISGWAVNDGYEFTGAKQPQPASTAEILAAHDAGVAATKANLTKVGDAGLGAPWTATAGGKTLLTMPKGALVRGLILNHWIHHRGQLSVYLRLLDVPVPSIYGPSADENPFG